MKYTAAVITVSDKCSRGERVDTSGPVLCAMLEEAGYEIIHTSTVPDEVYAIKSELINCADSLGAALILTTGGTGFSPRDITPEATLEVVERRTPGIAEAMRAESLRITPRGCLSRGEAGIRGASLIINLPGSEKAARENLSAVLGALDHGLEMLRGKGSADCAAPVYSKSAPSMDTWLREAKTQPDAEKIGMYLCHTGTVRATAKAAVRSGYTAAPAVKGMDFSYDGAKLAAVIDEAYKLEGIYHIRVWLNEGVLAVGDELMRVLVGGDIRPHATAALQYLLERIKTECVTETEIY